MSKWEAATNPPRPPTAPIGYAVPARREGCDPVYAPPPDPRALAAARRRAALADRISGLLLGPRVVHSTPLGGIFAHAPGDSCPDFCDPLLDSDP